jgi:hypothetical protein
MSSDSERGARKALRQITRWYFTKAYGSWEGPGILPYYCDPGRVGAFAVSPQALAAEEEEALFRLFVGMSMYQARRDVIIMKQQRGMTDLVVNRMASLPLVRNSIRSSSCSYLQEAESFEGGCSVRKRDGQVDCAEPAASGCHVRLASAALRRYGDSGKLPTSAWLRIWRHGGLAHLLSAVCRHDRNPVKRAELLVRELSKVFRVGRKLASMFVSALSVPALAPGLTPWFPRIDGASLVVIDTHVAFAIRRLSPKPLTGYERQSEWLRSQAAAIDLRVFGDHLPRVSARMVQQAVCVFGSRSNRAANHDTCSVSQGCHGCEQRLCPFTRQSG